MISKQQTRSPRFRNQLRRNALVSRPAERPLVAVLSFYTASLEWNTGGGRFWTVLTAGCESSRKLRGRAVDRLEWLGNPRPLRAAPGGAHVAS